jgi:hypothetical protein
LLADRMAAKEHKKTKKSRNSNASSNVSVRIIDIVFPALLCEPDLTRGT